jgi:hypothetical protein
MERMKIDGFSMAIGALAGGLAGGCVGYLLFRDRLRRQSEADIQSVKDYYRAKADDAERRAHIAAVELPASLGYGTPTQGDAPRVTLSSLISGNDPLEGCDDEDEEDDIQEPPPAFWPPVDRNTAKPYMISADEFADDIDGWQKMSITYYGLDHVLADDRDQPIDNVIATTGQIMVNDFGKQSGDPSIMHVRNHKLEIDFEILLKKQSYSEVVLGMGQKRVRGERT